MNCDDRNYYAFAGRSVTRLTGKDFATISLQTTTRIGNNPVSGLTITIDVITRDCLSLLDCPGAGVFIREIRPNVVPKNKKAFKSIRSEGFPEVSSGLPPVIRKGGRFTQRATRSCYRCE